MPSRIEILEDELLNQKVEAIVNVTNQELVPKTASEQALFAKAGPKLAEECTHITPCPTGEARITRGYGLSANFIIHTVSPVWGGGESGEDQSLASCYKNIFELVESFEITSLALPSLVNEETGFPEARAAHIAMAAISGFLIKNPDFKAIKLVVGDDRVIKAYETAFDNAMNA